MIVKVKEPQAVERKMLRPDHLLFTYLHLAPDPEQTADLVASGAVCIAYETVTDRKGRLPLLAPMSQVAGRLSIQAGATALQKANGGAGVLLGGVPGVAPAKTVVIGGGVVGAHAIEMAIGLGADVTVLDRNVEVLDALSARFGSRLKTVFSSRAALEKEVLAADLVVGAVLVAGAAAPKLVTKEHIKAMKPALLWLTLLSIRAVVLKLLMQRPIRIQPTSWMMWFTTAWQTCRALWHVPQLTR